jgi:hypothetical protein
MPAVQYTYSVAADTLNGKVNKTTLSQDIAASTITIALDHIVVTGDVLDIWFKASLTSLEITTVSDILAAHQGNMGVADSPDTIIAQLTLEGRNLLARAKLGNVVYRQLGWQLGRAGYQADRPVKVTPFVDNSSESMGYYELVDNTTWAIGTYISLNGKWFIYGTHFIEGATPALTIENIFNAILDSKDPAHYQIVAPVIDPLYPERLYIQSLMTGEVGNSYPLIVYHVGATINFNVTPMSGGMSATLEDPSWPLPPTLAPYSGTEGLIEIPSSTSLSFLSRVGEGTAGIGAYGELGLWVEILDSSYASEIGNQVLYAMSHFPIQPKTDRSIITFRTVISF